MYEFIHPKWLWAMEFTKVREISPDNLHFLLGFLHQEGPYLLKIPTLTEWKSCLIIILKSLFHRAEGSSGSIEGPTIAGEFVQLEKKDTIQVHSWLVMFPFSQALQTLQQWLTPLSTRNRHMDLSLFHALWLVDNAIMLNLRILKQA